ncbi:MAG: aminopeptidase P family protein [Bacteroidales bacterium]|nr:aminopeptidase P family protein [Bacteroidales bacterium]MBN2817835.1 aminopeptidase P family protein [Bacteroidales bacterium]
MFSADTYIKRRKELIKILNNKGLLLIAGNNEVPVNYPGNIYRFRQDSNFLYFIGIDLPGLTATINTETGETILYGNDNTVEDSVWTGNVPKLKDWAEQSGFQKVRSFSKLEPDLNNTSQIHYLPPYPHDRKILLSEIFKKTIPEIDAGYSVDFIKAVVKLRSIKTKEEVSQIEDALNRATSKFHIAAMKMALPGEYEFRIAGHIESTMLKNKCTPAYGIICSVRGEILHNVNYNNSLKAGQMLLIDAGAENELHYASDITRTTPVGGKFSEKQKAVYEIVLEALNSSISKIKPGITYRQIHLEAAKIIANGLINIGLMKGNCEEIVNAGAHALFFPHGLGHMLGLDVHDMEDLGEDYVGYNNDITRIDQFGTAYLRLGRSLEKGFVLTVEPGIYFIPQLIKKWKNEQKFKHFINYNKIDDYLDLGGIRIEDNVLVTSESNQVLGTPIPKSVNDIESLF